jgi:uncharacterized protein YeaO (DUF488 family)
MAIKLKRVYDEPKQADGYRVLVDRIWPRGLSKDDARIDKWLKDVAPSDQLRKWFHEDSSRWAEFRKRYLSQLKENRETLKPLSKRAKKDRITLVYGSKDTEHNNAVVVKQYLEMLSPD